MNLQERIIKHLETPTTGNRIFYDDSVKGFGLRITASGARSFVLNYRHQGRERRITIGAHPDFSVDAAREEAKKLKRQIASGADPLGSRNADRAAPTVHELADRYEREHLDPKLEKKRTLSAEDDRRMIRDYIRPALGAVKVAAVESTDIDKLHQKITKARKPYRANRVAALLSKMFALSIRWKMRDSNPCIGLERNEETPRERFLNDAELARLQKALAKHADRQACDIIYLLLLTGARRGEVLGARWVDLDLVKGIWTKPAHTTKQKKLHRVPLNPRAVELLAQLKREADPSAEHVFPGRGVPHRTNIKQPWQEIREAAKIEDVRLHDLRHNFASMLVSSGLSLPVIGGLLGHTNTATTARYAHLNDAVMREATAKVSDKIEMPRRGSR